MSETVGVAGIVSAILSAAVVLYQHHMKNKSDQAAATSESELKKKAAEADELRDRIDHLIAKYERYGDRLEKDLQTAADRFEVVSQKYLHSCEEVARLTEKVLYLRERVSELETEQLAAQGKAGAHEPADQRTHHRGQPDVPEAGI